MKHVDDVNFYKLSSENGKRCLLNNSLKNKQNTDDAETIIACEDFISKIEKASDRVYILEDVYAFEFDSSYYSLYGFYYDMNKIDSIIENHINNKTSVLLLRSLSYSNGLIFILKRHLFNEIFHKSLKRRLKIRLLVENLSSNSLSN